MVSWGFVFRPGALHGGFPEPLGGGGRLGSITTAGAQGLSRLLGWLGLACVASLGLIWLVGLAYSTMIS